MFFIKFFNPKINVKYIQTTEEAENGKIYHKFTVFDASNVKIAGMFAARMLAKKMMKKVFPLLTRLSRNTKNKEK